MLIIVLRKFSYANVDCEHTWGRVYMGWFRDHSKARKNVCEGLSGIFQMLDKEHLCAHQVFDEIPSRNRPVSAQQISSLKKVCVILSHILSK